MFRPHRDKTPTNYKRISNANGLEGKLQSGCRSESRSLFGQIDPPATEHDIAVIQHSRLSGGDRRLRIIEGDAKLVVTIARDASGLWRMVVANLRVTRQVRCAAQTLAEDVDLPRDQRALQQRFLLADRHTILLGIDVHDVDRITEGHTHALALPDREMLMARVRADLLAAGTD